MSQKEISFHFAHANGFPAGSYNTLFSALPKNFNRLHVDKFGHNPDFPVNANWRNQTRELINHVKSAQTDPQGVFAVGHSFGAVISYMAACEAPDLFRGLIMLDPPLVMGPMSHFFRLAKKTPLIDKLTPAKLAETRNTQWPAHTDMVAYFQGKGLFRNMDKRCVRDYVHAVTQTNGEYTSLTFKADIEAELFRTVPHNLNRYKGKLQCPALLVTGKDTTVCKPAMYNRLLKQNKIDHKIMPGGHMFPLEHPDAVAELISTTLLKWSAN